MVTFTDIKRASVCIKNEAVRTPLIKSALLDDLTKADVNLKPETLQRTGSFKFRGAYNAISNLVEKKNTKAVVAASSGNHAQGIAEAARLLGVKATIVMPSDAPSIKIERTKRSLAEVVLYDRMKEDRVAISLKISEETGAAFIHPYENADVISGQGTAGLEFCEDLKTMGKSLDRAFICTGGGGLTAGICLAVREFFPKANIHSCEPENFDDYARSLVANEILSNKTSGGSICDAIVTPSPGKLSFEICSGQLSDGMVCSDQQAKQAVAFAYNELKLVVEPGGAIALAALLSSKDKYKGETILVTLSGGNIDPKVLAECLDD